jgi:hypothetical protein
LPGAALIRGISPSIGAPPCSARRWACCSSAAKRPATPARPNDDRAGESRRFLIVLALDKQFQLSGTKLFTYFFRFYNAGVAITVTTMGARGVATVLGGHLPAAVSWIAGVGHVLLTVGLILLFVLLGKRLDAVSSVHDRS